MSKIELSVTKYAASVIVVPGISLLLSDILTNLRWLEIMFLVLSLISSVLAAYILSRSEARKTLELAILAIIFLWSLNELKGEYFSAKWDMLTIVLFLLLIPCGIGIWRSRKKISPRLVILLTIVTLTTFILHSFSESEVWVLSFLTNLGNWILIIVPLVFLGFQAQDVIGHYTLTCVSLPIFYHIFSISRFDSNQRLLNLIVNLTLILIFFVLIPLYHTRSTNRSRVWFLVCSIFPTLALLKIQYDQLLASTIQYSTPPAVKIVLWSLLFISIILIPEVTKRDTIESEALTVS